jgi:hypothetical protein
MVVACQSSPCLVLLRTVLPEQGITEQETTFTVKLHTHPFPDIPTCWSIEHLMRNSKPSRNPIITHHLAPFPDTVSRNIRHRFQSGTQNRKYPGVDISFI